MSNVGIKPLLTGVLFLSLVVVVGHQLDKKWQIRSVSIKNVSMPIRYVRIEGVFQFLSKSEIQNVLQPIVMAGFFGVDMQEIHATVSTLPWVDAVTVKRVWPDTIDVKVQERKPYARWGENSLITEQGTVFTPDNIEPFKDRILIIGPELQQLKVLEIMKGIKTALADHSMTLAMFSVNERGAWKIKLANELEILLGRNEQLKKLQRFLKTLTVLDQEQFLQIERVDLRYPNGYAVSWKPGTADIDWNAIAKSNNK
jgi:cell division protein FtsQ